MDLVHAINTALKAHHLFKRDVDYMVQDGKVVIVDEFTGRLMPGRRYSDGLHQALEAKERVKVEEENQTLASITFQNYFRMYKKLAGMTGTAATEATEFRHIYGLDVVEIPTNKTLIRLENPDVIYRTGEEKWNAVVEEIVELNEKGRPVLVGTISIEKSEHLSTLLRRKNVRHVVLNAKYHEQEAQIIAQAGRIGAVTIATNMAGRGVDILLGGNPEYLAREQLKKSGADLAKATPEQYEKVAAETSPRSPRRSTRPSSPSTASTSSAPSATRPGASTTSSAAAPAARATPARRASTSPSRTTSCASSAASASPASWPGSAWATACPSSTT